MFPWIITAIALLVLPAEAATTTTTLDSGTITGAAGSNGCGDIEDGSLTSTATLTLAEDSLVDITGILVEVGGSHGGCEVVIDAAYLTLDGTTVWSETIGVSGSGLSCCSWSRQQNRSPTGGRPKW